MAIVIVTIIAIITVSFLTMRVCEGCSGHWKLEKNAGAKPLSPGTAAAQPLSPTVPMSSGGPPSPVNGGMLSPCSPATAVSPMTVPSPIHSPSSPTPAVTNAASLTSAQPHLVTRSWRSLSEPPPPLPHVFVPPAPVVSSSPAALAPSPSATLMANNSNPNGSFPLAAAAAPPGHQPSAFVAPMPRAPPYAQHNYPPAPLSQLSRSRSRSISSDLRPPIVGAPSPAYPHPLAFATAAPTPAPSPSTSPSNHAFAWLRNSSFPFPPLVLPPLKNIPSSMDDDEASVQPPPPNGTVGAPASSSSTLPSSSPAASPQAQESEAASPAWNDSRWNPYARAGPDAAGPFPHNQATYDIIARLIPLFDARCLT